MSGLDQLSLGISIGDVFTIISTFFTQFWYLIALGLGLIAFPKVVKAVRGAIGGGGRA